MDKEMGRSVSFFERCQARFVENITVGERMEEYRSRSNGLRLDGCKEAPFGENSRTVVGNLNPRTDLDVE